MSNEVQKKQNYDVQSTASRKFAAARRSISTVKTEWGEGCEVEQVFLLDVSYSMDSHVGDKRKIDHLRDAVGSYLSEVPIISFSTRTFVDEIPEPNGSTEMASAFERCREMFKPSRILVVSDGEPTDGEAKVLETAVSMHVPVDTLYIGQKGDRGEEFLKKLSELTGGKQVTAETVNNGDFVRQLTDGIRLLCDNTKSNTINL